jgi:pentose-5-phosphate-3-epimerase
VNLKLAAHVDELGAVLAGSILGVPRSRQLTEATALYGAGAWIHLDLIDGGYPIGKGISRDILIEVIKDWPSATDIHLISGHHQLDGVSLDGVGRLTVHLEPGEENSSPRPAGARESWISIQPHAWTGAMVDRLLARWQPDGVLMMLTPPGDPRFQADLTAPDTQAWTEARSQTRLGVDGGVAEPHLSRIVAAGARYVVVGRALFNHSLPPSLEPAWTAVFPGPVRSSAEFIQRTGDLG